MEKASEYTEHITNVITAALMDNPLLRKMLLPHDELEGLLPIVLSKWHESHRYYHTIYHLKELLDKIDIYPEIKSDEDRYILQIVALFHDVVYDPRSNTNEEDSEKFFRAALSDVVPYTETISDIILDTKNHNPTSDLSKWFCDLDLWSLSHGSLLELIENEGKIFREFQFVDYPTYKRKRLDFIVSMRKRFNNPNLAFLLDYIQHRRPKIGIYAGSFDPMHKGHLSILRKAERLFDKVIVAVAVNQSKLPPHPDHDILYQRKIQIQCLLPYREVVVVNGWMTDFIESVEDYADCTFIRGVRSGYDLEYEINMLRFMEDMYPDIEVVWIPSDREYTYLSSSALRDMASIDRNSTWRYIGEENE